MKIYTKTYSHLYAEISKASPPLSVPAGKKKCFAVPFPTEGLIERVIVSQVPDDTAGFDGGPAVNFEIELLCSKVPFPAGLYDPGDAPRDTLEQYRIQMPPTGPLTRTAGNVLSLTDDEFGLSYRNVDGGFTENQRFIYLVIKPISAATITLWNVFILARTDVG